MNEVYSLGSSSHLQGRPPDGRRSCWNAGRGDGDLPPSAGRATDEDAPDWNRMTARNQSIHRSINHLSIKQRKLFVRPCDIFVINLQFALLWFHFFFSFLVIFWCNGNMVIFQGNKVFSLLSCCKVPTINPRQVILI